MADADIIIVAIIFVFAMTFGTFQYLYVSEPTIESNIGVYNQTYDTPDSEDFFGTMDNMVKLNVDNPEIFWINTILFGLFVILLAFIGLRFLRGTG